MKRPEDTLHEAVWLALKLALPPEAVAISHENRQNGPREGARRKKRGCLPGWPDLEIVHAGRHHLIELKTPVGTLSKAQREMHARLTQAGGSVAVCRSVDAVLAHLAACGVPVRARVSA